MCRLGYTWKILKGGCNALTKSKSFADAFLNQTCVVTAGYDYAVFMPLREARTCADSVVFMQSRFNSVWFLVLENK